MTTQQQALWQSPCGNQETGRDAAERFVREAFAAERKIIWGQTPGEFCFADGYWCYRISCQCGHWYVHRTSMMTPQAKSRARGRQESRK